MTIDSLRSICLGFPHSTEDIKWGQDLCFCVGAKMFLVIVPDKSPICASFKTTPEEYAMLFERPGFIPAPYAARNHWVYVEDINLVSTIEWKRFAKNSYDLVVARLPSRFRS